MRRSLAILEAQAAVALRGGQDAATQDYGPVEQGRPEPGNQARCSVDARLRRCAHAGRRSGRRYQTPVNVFPAADGYLLALTYGPDSDWVKNVLAAGGCELVTRGRTVRLVSPQLVHDENRRGIRPLERQVLRLIGVADFLSLKTASAAGAKPTGIA
jgi:deazaflavin-dependent oxidoreductase (nitroreductase family)